MEEGWKLSSDPTIFRIWFLRGWGLGFRAWVVGICEGKYSGCLEGKVGDEEKMVFRRVSTF